MLTRALVDLAKKYADKGITPNGLGLALVLAMFGDVIITGILLYLIYIKY